MPSCPFSDPLQALFNRGVPLLVSAGLLIAGAILFSLDDLMVELIALTFMVLGIGLTVLRLREIVCCQHMRKRLLDKQPHMHVPRCF